MYLHAKNYKNILSGLKVKVIFTNWLRMDGRTWWLKGILVSPPFGYYYGVRAIKNSITRYKKDGI